MASERRASEQGHEATVGCRIVELVDHVQPARIALWVLYPARAPEHAERVGPYSLPVAIDAAVAGERLPLVVISHGNGGSPWIYRDLAAHLVRAGFVLALFEHPGDNRSDRSLSGTAANLVNRPRHVKLVIDAVLADAHLGKHVAATAIGAIGHSIGAYTVLALAGGNPSAFPYESPDGQPHSLTVVHDSRVRALVLLTPATPWFTRDGALRAVDLPIWMLTGALDEHAPAFMAEIVKHGVRDPARVEHRVIANAGHFSFVSPFPAEMVKPEFPPSQDPEGFDRVAFQPVLHEGVLAFLDRTLRH